MTVVGLNVDLCLAPWNRVEAANDVVVKCGLVALEREDVMSAPLADCLRDVGVAVSGVSRDCGSSELQTREKFERGGRFVAGRLDGGLSEEQTLLRGPDVQQMERSASSARVRECPAKCLAVDRDSLALKVSEQRLEPRAKGGTGAVWLKVAPVES